MKQNNKYLLILLSSILIGLSQHDLNLGFLSWFGIIPLIHVLVNTHSFKSILKFSFLWGFLYNISVVFWLSTNIGTTKLIATISMFAAVLILSFNTVFTAMIWYLLRDKYKKFSLIIFSIIWISIEYVRSFGLLGFPWISIANSQTDYLLLVQNAEYTGIYGISFWVLLLNINLYQLIFKSFDKDLMIKFCMIFIFPWITGYILFNKQNIELKNIQQLEILSVQPNVNLFDKRNYTLRHKNLNDLINQTIENLNDETQLILWPESAIPYHKLQNSNDRNYIINRLLANQNFELITGNVFYEGIHTYNSSVLLNKNGIKDVYHKRQLVPLAEHVPFSENFNYLKNINLGQANFSKGKEDRLFNVNDFNLATLICFESTFPQINRRHALKGADALVYLVNDGWYLTNPEPAQHAGQAIYRAVENRLPVIRCANTGISMVINSKGEIENSIDLNNKGTMQAIINKNSNRTFYTRFGDVFALILVGITILLLIIKKFKHE